MRKAIAIILLCVVIALLLCGCGVLTMNGYELSAYHMEEWVSPDGVHYWVTLSGNREGLAPRYDSNGQLVIDEVTK